MDLLVNSIITISAVVFFIPVCACTKFIHIEFFNQYDTHLLANGTT